MKLQQELKEKLIEIIPLLETIQKELIDNYNEYIMEITYSPWLSPSDKKRYEEVALGYNRGIKIFIDKLKEIIDDR